jgi:hypothetical protein
MTRATLLSTTAPAVAEMPTATPDQHVPDPQVAKELGITLMSLWRYSSMSNDASGINAIANPVPDRHADQRLKASKATVRRVQDELFAAANKDKPTAGGDMKLNIHRSKP